MTALFATSVHSSGRYFLDQNSNPWFATTNSPQLMTSMISTGDMLTFFSDQQGRGYNSSQIHLIADDDIGAHAGGVNFYGDAPFVGGSFANPNAAYWAVVDTMVSTAQTYGCTLFLTVVDNISYGIDVQFSSDADLTSYGTFLGNRYKGYPNIVWVVGNDYGSGVWAARDPKYKKIVDAIKATGDTHLFTFWLGLGAGVDINTSWDDTFWASYVDCAGVYRYGYTYYQTELAYAHTGTKKPVFLQEAAYEDEFIWDSSTNNESLRRQAWWVPCWGGIGGITFGQHLVWQFASGWPTKLGTTATTQAARVGSTISGLTNWWKLAPDTGHTFCTAGFGTHDTSTASAPLNNDFAPVSLASDGSLAVGYFPTQRSGIAVNTALMSGSVSAYWLDPTNGSTVTISNLTAPTHPGANASGSHDWVMVYTSAAVTLANAGNALAQATAFTTSATVKPGPSATSATATARQPGFTLAPHAGNALAAGAAGPIGIGAVGPFTRLATATATANSQTPSISTPAGSAAALAAAFNAEGFHAVFGGPLNALVKFRQPGVIVSREQPPLEEV